MSNFSAVLASTSVPVTSRSVLAETDDAIVAPTVAVDRTLVLTNTEPRKHRMT
jgi:hypothetical protein